MRKGEVETIAHGSRREHFADSCATLRVLCDAHVMGSEPDGTRSTSALAIRECVVRVSGEGQIAATPNALIDDEDADRARRLADALAAGQVAIAAEAGAENVRCVFVSTGRFDASAEETIDGLREAFPDAAIFVIAGEEDTDRVWTAIDAGADAFVREPYVPSFLAITVGRELERKKLAVEVSALRDSLPSDSGLGGFVGRSEARRRVVDRIRKVAGFDATVLLLGETGTGKELAARALHNLSLSRREGPFVSINCGAIPESLLEAELFGHARGAFTGAVKARVGHFERAHGGTLFLDEIGDMPMALQVKILRVLEDGNVTRLGESRGRRVNARVVTATSRDIENMVQLGTFREDLFYRLNVVPIRLAPLRERRDDVAILAGHFLDRLRERGQTNVRRISAQAVEILEQWDWPGNVRELSNVIERSAVFARGDEIGVEDLPPELRPSDSRDAGAVSTVIESLSIKQESRKLERALIAEAMKRTGGNRTHAAKLLEISYRALVYKIRDYFPDGIDED